MSHSIVSLTLDTYSHLLPTIHQPAATAMDRLLTALGTAKRRSGRGDEPRPDLELRSPGSKAARY